jgi:hypothetical protein
MGCAPVLPEQDREVRESGTIIGQLWREVEVPKPPLLSEIAQATVRGCLFWRTALIEPNVAAS